MEREKKSRNDYQEREPTSSVKMKPTHCEDNATNTKPLLRCFVITGIYVSNSNEFCFFLHFDPIHAPIDPIHAPIYLLFYFIVFYAKNKK